MKVLFLSSFLLLSSFCNAQKKLDSVVMVYDNAGNMVEKRYYSEAHSFSKVREYFLLVMEGLKPKKKWAY